MPDGRASPAPPTSGIIVQQLQQREAPVFHGYPDEDPDDWLKAYERVAKYNRWDDVAKLVNVAFSLACAAFVWFENHERDIDTWENFKHHFRQAFSVISRARTAETQLRNRRQRPGEHVRDYYEDVLRLCARADPSMSDERKLEHLMKGVRDEFFAPLTSTPPMNPAGFYNVCYRVEKQLELRRLGSWGAPIQWEDSAIPANDLQTMIRQLIKTELAALREEIVASIRSEICVLSPSATAARTHATNYPVSQEPSRPPTANDIQAIVRNELHAALDVPRRSVSPPPMGSQRVPIVRRTDQWRTAANVPVCFHCGRTGHVQRYCRLRQPPSNSPISHRPQSSRQQSPPRRWTSPQRQQTPSSPRYRYDHADFPSLPSHFESRSRTPSPPNDEMPTWSNIARRRSPSPAASRRRSASPGSRISRRDTLN